ncbi:MAG TPA: hypothetical protein VI976_00025, partial [Candidatus Omnitrophota bacterium]|nr:hypothetical protein [Candidatus Omnitrophota bacterium]
MIRGLLESQFLRQGPKHLILHVTNRCNLRCKNCFIDFERADKREISPEKIEELAVYLKRLIWLDIGGGEPF